MHILRLVKYFGEMSCKVYIFVSSLPHASKHPLLLKAEKLPPWNACVSLDLVCAYRQSRPGV